MRRAFIRALGVPPAAYRGGSNLPLSPALVTHPKESRCLNVAILLYDQFTALDAIGPYEVLSRLRDTQVTFIAEQPGPVTADTGMLSVVAGSMTDLPHPDLVLVPGGPGQEQQMDHEVLLDWLRAADARPAGRSRSAPARSSWPPPGLLAGRRATSHWLALDWLADYGARPVSERVVIDGKYITCAGVSAGIDMALELAGRIGGRVTAESIQLMIEYDAAAALPRGLAADSPGGRGDADADRHPARGPDRGGRLVRGRRAGAPTGNGPPAGTARSALTRPGRVVGARTPLTRRRTCPRRPPRTGRWSPR